jgi:aminobenzoyl-glutamate utilization protein A
MSTPDPTTATDRLVQLRRDLHRHPEPAWCEFYTTARIVEELERIGVDDLSLGEEVYAAFEGERTSVPDADELETWRNRAVEAGADPEIVDRMGEGYTGAVAVLRMGDGPTIGIRTDIDGLEREESTADDHRPAAAGFRSEIEGMMHACGHDAHATFGVGTLAAITESDFTGTLKVFFQPGEEKGAGGEPMATGGHLDDVDYLYAVHVGLDEPTGTVVPGISEFLAVSGGRADFTGVAAHAGGKPEAGRNALLAMSTAIQQLYAIPRHHDGATRVGVGPASGGSASNVVPEAATLNFEVRGASMALHDHMREWATRVIESAGALHDCGVDIQWGGSLPTAPSDEALTQLVDDVATVSGRVTDIEYFDSPDGSEDATYLMREVQEHGGLACYLGIGSDSPGGHHTPTFDVDEEALGLGVDVLAETVLETERRQP